MKTLIIDYDRGNIRSVCRSILESGGDYILSSDSSEIKQAERVILPGVGAFGDCIGQLERLNLIEAIHEFIETERPLLGICVGMQILLSTGEEFGSHKGLDLIKGKVHKIADKNADGIPHKIPHIGWSPIYSPEDAPHDWKGTPLEHVPTNSYVYFIHSFTAAPDEATNRLADSNYNGVRISAAIHKNNITGLQFHPEKSAQVGLKIIETFLNL